MWNNPLNRVAAVWLLLIAGEIYYVAGILNKGISTAIEFALICIIATLTLALLSGFLFYNKTLILHVYKVLSCIIAVIIVLASVNSIFKSYGGIYFWTWDAIDLGLCIISQMMIAIPTLVYEILRQKLTSAVSAGKTS